MKDEIEKCDHNNALEQVRNQISTVCWNEVKGEKHITFLHHYIVTNEYFITIVEIAPIFGPPNFQIDNINSHNYDNRGGSIYLILNKI